MEIAWADNNDVMDHGEALVRHIARTLLTERPTELESLGRDLEVIRRFAESDYPRIRYDEAVERLKSKGVEIEWGQTWTIARRRSSQRTLMCRTS